MFIKKIKDFYRLLKEKKVDDILISVGILGILVGFVFSPSIREIAVWPVLLGVCIKLYDFTEDIERNIIPYNFNNLLPPPKKKD
ncbi:hypothetical protein KO488_09960 [Poseidonibacter lekithochrous]|uniref:hypothetical protein n=1 Tax=Poseidonibacter TaxID=2321187 RepID=UPI001C099694|nr:MULTISPECIES: hypothetical protein [Poseidonibacter]MBU3015081.1 hypothetical protein [Poseidonibacter lekithochrous]MDO6828377.1 hypothetical protein [Poseidonibacter sp. 1_MG-2023]